MAGDSESRVRVLIDGEAVGLPDASISVLDWALQRGDGCFEALRSYGGSVFRLADHLNRLASSASAMSLPLPDRSEIAQWCEELAADAGSCVVRVIATRGARPRHPLAPARLIVISEPVPPMKKSYSFGVEAAPWHPAGRDWGLAGAKTLSYGPNVAASRQARSAGFDDALLVSDDGTLLEGPIFSVAWSVSGVVETPGLDLGILESITRAVTLEVARASGIEVVEGRFHIDRLSEADEVMALSTIREVAPVHRVGDLVFPAGRVTDVLRRGFRQRVANECGAWEPSHTGDR